MVVSNWLLTNRLGVRVPLGAQTKFEEMAKEKTNFKMEENPTKLKLGEVFEVEGKLYAIQIPKTGTEDTPLSGGRQIYEFTVIPGL